MSKGRCHRCNELGLRSTVQGRGGVTTLMSYQPHYDEDGQLHLHDPNVHTALYRCSQGHTWTESWTARCGVEGCEFGTTKTIRYKEPVSSD